jgi:hypothetical protein
MAPGREPEIILKYWNDLPGAHVEPGALSSQLDGVVIQRVS